MNIVRSPLPTLEPAPLKDVPCALPKKGPSLPISAPVKVLYIVGYGRGGTTLLDIALGEHSAIMGGGEIATLARHVWAANEYCACGAAVRSCPVWSAVVKDWKSEEPAALMGDYGRAQRRTETIMGFGRATERLHSPGHARATEKLFRRIAARTCRKIVVDSSKLPGRGFSLAATPGIDLHVVHVVRDPRGVAWSLKQGFKRQLDKGLQRDLRPKSLFYTALRWSIVNLASELLCRRLGPQRSLRVRYEDFTTDNGATISRIISMVGEHPQPRELDAPLRPQHQVAGSRHRMQRAIAIVRDEGWKSAMPRVQQVWISILTAPLLLRYGYTLRTADHLGGSS